MSNKKPFFTVIIATYNRADVVHHSIRSVLEQTFGDFQLIVSNNQSTDNTDEVVRSFDDARLQYIQTPKFVSGIENFEYAIGFATGEYIMYLGDDDAFSLISLQLVHDILEREKEAQLVAWKMCQYFLEDATVVTGKLKENTLLTRKFTGQTLTKNSRQSISDIFAFDGLIDASFKSGELEDLNDIPSLVNAAYHRNIVKKVNDIAQFFHKQCASGDRYNVVAVLSQMENYIFIDLPLHLHGAWSRSATATFESARKYFQSSTEPMLTPFNIATHRNYSANGLLIAHADLKDFVDYIEIDWLNFFAELYKDLFWLKRRGFDTGEDLAEFQRVLAEQPAEFQQKFYAAVPSKLGFAVKNVLFQTWESISPAYEKLGLKKIKNLSGTDSNLVKIEGFENIFDCAKKLDAAWFEKYKSPQSKV